MPHYPETLIDIFKGLHESSAKYLLTGGVAMSFHGLPRMTYDLDLVSPEDEIHSSLIHSLLERWGYLLKGEERSAPGIRIERFLHNESPLREIDVALLAPSEFAELSSRSERFIVLGTAVPVLSVKDLVSAKEKRGRPSDREDLPGLKALEPIPGEGREAEGPEKIVDQIVKFRRWSMEKRCEWLLAGSRLRLGLPPDKTPRHSSPFRRKNPWERRK